MGSGILVLNQPGVYLVDADGNIITLADGSAIGQSEGLMVMGKDGANARLIRVASDGTIRIDPTGVTTQPVSASSLPLPVGASTEATLATRATETKLESVRALLATIDTDTSTLASVDYATQTTLATLLTQVTGAAIQTVLEAIKDTSGIKKITDALPAGDNDLGRVKITNGSDVADVVEDRHSDISLRVSSAPVEHVRLLGALHGIEQQLKKLVCHMELMTDESIKEIRDAD